ncbi:MAG TPA: hypothetical protein EYP34_14235, partial [Chromatiaceae bacterium]|nr:hypothetical protein [Chromatiaceae bacterium]
MEAADTYFPSIHADKAGELIKLTCFISEDLKGITKTISGLDDQAVRYIVGASRYGENSALSGIGVIVSVNNPHFSGRSYGLALALADKILRYGKAQNNGRIIATGLVEPDGCGRVDGIQSLNNKLRLIVDHVRSGDSIWFPQVNLDTNDKEQQQLLRDIRAAGANLHAISHVNQGEGLLWPETTKVNEEPARQPKVAKRQWLLATGLLLVLLVASLLLLKPQMQHLWKAPVASEPMEIEPGVRQQQVSRQTENQETPVPLS